MNMTQIYEKNNIFFIFELLNNYLHKHLLIIIACKGENVWIYKWCSGSKNVLNFLIMRIELNELMYKKKLFYVSNNAFEFVPK